VLGGVVISYRREDSGIAGRIYDRLAKRLGRKNIFIDVDNIPPGLDFVDVFSERVNACDALVVVIGKNWISATGKDNRRRLDDPPDFVRIEVETALERGVRVIPVLVDGADMPRPEDLPDSLQRLARRQGIDISYTRFDSDVKRLTDALSLLWEDLRKRDAAEAERATTKERGGAAATNPGLFRQIFDCRGTDDLPGYLVRQEGDAPTTDVIVNEVYDNLGIVYRFFKEIFGRDSLNDRGKVLVASVHYSTGYANVFWNGINLYLAIATNNYLED
jgi:hypothetical protein